MKKKVLKRVGIAFAVLIILGAIGSSESQKSETQNSVLNQKTEQSETKDPKEEIEVQKTYDVVKVVDGDTIDVDMDGKVQRIRLIGVNTPETVHPNKDVEYFGKEASEYTKQNLNGKKFQSRRMIRKIDMINTVVCLLMSLLMVKTLIRV